MTNKLLILLSKISIFDNFFYPITIKNINKKKINFLDVGAAGELIPRWKRVSDSLYLICFEPDKTAFKKLTAKISKKSGVVFNKALSSSVSKKIIYNCLDPEKSSLYKPNFGFLKKFHNPERYSIKKKLQIYTDTLDNQKNINVDFIKLDTQGSELDIIRGGKKLLEQCIGIEIEVEFQEIYKKQPLFGDIHKILESKGFEFVDFTEKVYWSYLNSKLSGSKLVFANALFVRKEDSLKFLSKEKILKYISICLIYNKMSYVDNAIRYLNFFDAKALKKQLFFFYLRSKIIIFLKKMFNFFIKFLGIDLSNNNIN